MDTTNVTTAKLPQHEFSNATSYADMYFEPTMQGYFFRARLAHVREILEKRFTTEVRGAGLLDVGCGPCHIAPAALELGFSYTGIDVSESMVQYSLGRYGHHENFSAIVTDIGNLPFPAQHFDIVTTLGSLEYMADLDVALREIGRVLRPGGVLIASMLNGANPRMRQFCKQEIVYSRDKLTSILESSCLQVDSVRYFHFHVLPSPLDRQYPRWDTAIGSLLSKAYPPGTHRLASAYLLTARLQVH